MDGEIVIYTGQTQNGLIRSAPYEVERKVALGDGETFGFVLKGSQNIWHESLFYYDPRPSCQKLFRDNMDTFIKYHAELPETTKDFTYLAIICERILDEIKKGVSHEHLIPLVSLLKDNLRDVEHIFSQSNPKEVK